MNDVVTIQVTPEERAWLEKRMAPGAGRTAHIAALLGKVYDALPERPRPIEVGDIVRRKPYYAYRFERLRVLAAVPYGNRVRLMVQQVGSPDSRPWSLDASVVEHAD